MGNCMVVEEKVVKVMRPDGKILEYSSPTMVQQVLSDFPGQSVCDYSSLQNQQSLLPEAKLVGGRLYCLVPLPPASPQQVVVKKKKKKVRFAVPEEEGEKERDQDKKGDGDDAPGKTTGGGVVRIKLVITKQELEELLNKGGVSVSDMVSHLQDQQRLVKVDVGDGGGDQQQQQQEEEWQRSWKPALESIPEMA